MITGPLTALLLIWFEDYYLIVNIGFIPRKTNLFYFCIQTFVYAIFVSIMVILVIDWSRGSKVEEGEEYFGFKDELVWTDGFGKEHSVGFDEG